MIFDIVFKVKCYFYTQRAILLGKYGFMAPKEVFSEGTDLLKK